MAKVINGFHLVKTYEERKRLELEESNIYKIARYIQQKLIGKEITVISCQRTIHLNFKPENVGHLLGIYHLDGSRQLWLDLKRNRLDVRKLAIKDDGTTFVKISSMQSITELFEGKGSRLIGSMLYQKTHFDSGIRTKRLLLGIGLLAMKNGRYIPNTALDIHRKPIETGEEILAIYTKDRRTKEIKILQKKAGYEIDFSKSELKEIKIENQERYKNQPFQNLEDFFDLG